jgi:hypothetical protein
MANNSEEGQGSQRAVVPVMMMMMMMIIENIGTVVERNNVSKVLCTAVTVHTMA